MSLPNPFYDFAFGEFFDTVLSDFILAFTFFTAVVYAVLSRRFGEQRPAVAMSGALGMALAVGLVSWDYFHGYSVRNLGPIAVGFGVIILGGVIYQSIRGAGGSWAGVGIGMGACLLVGWTLGLDWSIDQGIVQTVITVALTIGILAFFLHRRGVGAVVNSFSHSAHETLPAFTFFNGPVVLFTLRHVIFVTSLCSKRGRGWERDRFFAILSTIRRVVRLMPELADGSIQRRQPVGQSPSDGWPEEGVAHLYDHGCCLPAPFIQQCGPTRAAGTRRHAAGVALSQGS